MLDLKQELDDLVALPEGLDSGELKHRWERILDAWDADPGPVLPYIECMSELANRQWHAYEKADEPICNRIAVWLSRVWHLGGQRERDACVGIVGSLGLSSCVQLIRDLIEDPATDPERARALEREIEEWGPPPLDPWRSLRRNPA